MATSHQSLIAQNEHQIRLVTYLNEGTDQLRNILHNPIHGNLPVDEKQLYQALLPYKKKLHHLKKDQLAIVFPGNKQTNSKLFDITILVNLLITCTNIPAPVGGWKIKSPQTTDLSIGADIIRLRNIRNNVMHGRNITFVQFSTFWGNITDVLDRLGYNVDDAKDLKSGTLDDLELFKISILQSKMQIREFNEPQIKGDIQQNKNDIQQNKGDIQQNKDDTQLNKDDIHLNKGDIQQNKNDIEKTVVDIEHNRSYIEEIRKDMKSNLVEVQDYRSNQENRLENLDRNVASIKESLTTNTASSVRKRYPSILPENEEVDRASYYIEQNKQKVKGTRYVMYKNVCNNLVIEFDDDDIIIAKTEVKVTGNNSLWSEKLVAEVHFTEERTDNSFVVTILSTMVNAFNKVVITLTDFYDNKEIISFDDIQLACVHSFENRTNHFTVLTHNAAIVSKKIESIVNVNTIEHDIEFVCGGKALKMTFTEYEKMAIDYLHRYFSRDEKLSEAIMFPPLTLKQRCSNFAFRLKNILSGNNNILAVITNYNSHEHLHILKQDASFLQSKESPCIKDRLLLLHSNAMINIRYTETTNVDIVKKEFEDGEHDIELLSALNKKYVVEDTLTFVNMVIAPQFSKIENNNICNECHLLDKNDVSLDSNIQEKFSNLLQTKNNSCDTMYKNILSQIICFMATRKALHGTIPTLNDNIHEQIKTLMLTSEQMRILFHKSKKKIIIGSLGSGKTVLALAHLELFYERCESPSVIYYVIWTDKTLLFHDIKNHVKRYNLNKNADIKVKGILEVVEELRLTYIPTVSQLLNLLVAKHGRSRLHFIADEVDGEMFDSMESSSLKQYFEKKKKEEKNENFVVLFPQSIEKHRKLVTHGVIKEHGKYMYHETSMTVLHLNKAMRTTECNHEFLKVYEEKLLQVDSIIRHTALGKKEKVNVHSSSYIRRSINFKKTFSPEKFSQASPDEEIIEQNTPKQSKMSSSLASSPSKASPKVLELQPDIDVLSASIDDSNFSNNIKTVTKVKFNTSALMGHNIKGSMPSFVYVGEEEKGRTEDELTVMIALAFENISSCRSDTNRFFLYSSQLQFNVMLKLLRILDLNFYHYSFLTNWKIMKNDGSEVESVPVDGCYNLLTNQEGSRGMEAEECIVAIDLEDCKLRHLTVECMSRATDRLILISASKKGLKDCEPSSIGHIIKELSQKHLRTICIRSHEHPEREISYELSHDINDNKQTAYVNVNSWRFKELTNNYNSIDYDDMKPETVDENYIKKLLQIPTKVDLACFYVRKTSCLLRWQREDDHYKYIVRRQDNNASTWVEVQSDLSSDRCQIENLEHGEKYEFEVVAVNRSGSSETSIIPYHHINTTSTSFHDIEQLIRNNKIDEMKNIISSHPNIIYLKSDDKYEWTPLIYAVVKNKLSMVKLFIEYKIDVWIDDDNKENAYHYCAGHGFYDILEYLCQHDISHINRGDVANFTPLHWAAYYGNIKCVELLMRCHADVTIETISGRTAYDRTGYKDGRNKEEIKKIVFNHLNMKTNMTLAEEKFFHRIKANHT